MSLNGYLKELIGKTIKNVVVKRAPSRDCLFLVFDDGTSFEFFGDFHNEKGCWPRGLEGVLNYCPEHEIIMVLGE